MAVTATPVFPQVPKSFKVQILPADASGLKTIATGGTNGSKVNAIVVSSSDTAARDVSWGITNTSIFYVMGTVTIPITAGQIAATPAVNLLDITKTPGLPIDADGNPYILLASSSDTLQIKALTTVTAAKEIDVSAVGADF